MTLTWGELIAKLEEDLAGLSKDDRRAVLLFLLARTEGWPHAHTRG